jgi:hypothetical protein
MIKYVLQSYYYQRFKNTLLLFTFFYLNRLVKSLFSVLWNNYVYLILVFSIEAVNGESSYYKCEKDCSIFI